MVRLYSERSLKIGERCRIAFKKKKMFPKYLTPGKNISNKLVLIEIEEKFQIED